MTKEQKLLEECKDQLGTLIKLMLELSKNRAKPLRDDNDLAGSLLIQLSLTKNLYSDLKEHLKDGKN